MKKIFEILKKYVVLFLILTSIYMLVVLSSAKIPFSIIKNNVGESISVLEKERTYPQFQLPNTSFYYDNWTDAIFFNVMINQSDSKKLYTAALLNKVDTISPGDSDYIELENLKASFNNSNTGSWNYLNYWFGYLPMFKTLLIFFDLVEIRTLLYVIGFGMISLILIKIKEKFGWKSSFAFGFSMLFSWVSINLMCITYACDIFTMLFSILLILYFSKKDNYSDYEGRLFFLIGSLTMFGCLLTFPLVTLGMPIIISTQINQEKIKKKIDVFKKVIKNSFLWVFGYGLTLITKVLFSIPFSSSESGSSKIIKWIGDNSFSERIEWIIKRIDYFFAPKKIKLIMFVSLIIICIILMIIKRNKKIDVKLSLIYLFIALFPVLWNFVFSSHAFHPFESYFYMISIYSILIVTLNLFDFKPKKEKL